MFNIWTCFTTMETFLGQKLFGHAVFKVFFLKKERSLLSPATETPRAARLLCDGSAEADVSGVELLHVSRRHFQSGVVVLLRPAAECRRCRPDPQRFTAGQHRLLKATPPDRCWACPTAVPGQPDSSGVGGSVGLSGCPRGGGGGSGLTVWLWTSVCVSSTGCTV